jgi:hypothetical protein
MENTEIIFKGKQSDLLNYSKTDLTAKANELAVLVENGTADTIDALISVKKQQFLLSEVEERIRANSNISFQKGGTERFGCKIESAEAGGKYDYSNCGCPVWERLNKEANEANEKLKKWQDYLKSLPNCSQPLVDEITGESYQLSQLPIKVGGKQTIKVTIK